MPVSGERRSAVPMRFGWGVLVGLSLTLFVLSIPARYEELAEVGRRASAQLGPRDDLLLHFLSRGAYAPTVLSLEVVFVLALTLASVEMVWRNWSDWRPLFFSAVFVTYSVWVTPTLDALGLPPVLQTLADLMQAAGLLIAIHFFLLDDDRPLGSAIRAHGLRRLQGQPGGGLPLSLRGGPHRGQQQEHYSIGGGG